MCCYYYLWCFAIIMTCDVLLLLLWPVMFCYYDLWCFAIIIIPVMWGEEVDRTRYPASVSPAVGDLYKYVRVYRKAVNSLTLIGQWPLPDMTPYKNVHIGLKKIIHHVASNSLYINQSIQKIFFWKHALLLYSGGLVTLSQDSSTLSVKVGKSFLGQCTKSALISSNIFWNFFYLRYR